MCLMKYLEDCPVNFSLAASPGFCRIGFLHSENQRNMLSLLGLVGGAFIASPLHAPQLAEQHHARALLPRAAPSAIVFDLGDLLGRKFGVQAADVFAVMMARATSYCQTRLPLRCRCFSLFACFYIL